MADPKRKLTDSEARWQAVCLIDAATRNAVNSGALWNEGAWTEADELAIERHIYARLNGLLRRPRKAASNVQEPGQTRLEAQRAKGTQQ